ncbi:PID-CTERM protein-sorting domain-containing protein [Hymenobacter sp. IS2118]|uniref:PID-CTERM protein-sorting domain-containing protein n=1 Tax=Hymenobacter sp. IS2118 TaxID=1505605 RepID=UPI000556724D|nr:hypothetical protein [Hymenobacter sp. IS2118]
MKKHTNYTILLVMAFSFLFLAGDALAQPDTGGPGPGTVTVPVDGGASLLLAAGAAYGLRRLRQRRKA